MYTSRLITLIGLTIFAQGALANTIWLKDRLGNVCYNSDITNPNNPSKIIGAGGVNHDGTGFTLTIDNPATGTVTPSTGDCTTIPKAASATPIVFSIGSVNPRLMSNHMWKPGTKGALECLDQGVNLSGLSGVLISSNGQYRMLLSTVFTDGCNMQTQTKITVDGQPMIVRTAAIFGGGAEAPLYQGNYHIFNVATVPEPGSILLLLAGASAMGVLTLARRRSGKSKANTGQ